MRLGWDISCWGLIFFGLFFFGPLHNALGPDRTMIIICVGIVGIAVVKVVEYQQFFHGDDDG